MKLAATWVVLMLVLVTTPSRAGVNLMWENCPGDGGVALETFACGTNSGEHTLVASFVTPEGMPALTSLEAVVDLCSMSAPFPDWWQFMAQGSCRQSALSLSTDFSASPPVTCADLWQGSGLGALSYYIREGSWNTARITVVVSTLTPLAVEAGTEYSAFKLRISNVHTVGDGACTGCMTPICIVLNQINLVSAETLQPLATPQMNYAAQWQQVLPNCPFSVPAANRTWGQVKSLYR